MRSKLAELIAKREGFGIPGAVPTRRNNPGDLRHSPHSSHEGIGPNDIGIIDTVEHGWEDLERQIRLYAQRGYTLRKMIEAWAPPSENETEAYIKFVCDGLGKSPDTLVKDAL